MIEQRVNYADSTVKEISDYFETRVENLKLREDKKKSFAYSKGRKYKKATKKRKGKRMNNLMVYNMLEPSLMIC